MAFSTAEGGSFAVVDCLLDQNHVLHIDGLPEKSIKAREIDMARRELPKLAESCGKDSEMINKLRAL
ncbi:MAG: hypothetical protein ACU843_16125, partial [Gammaproteobacteria bacterium]